MPNLIKLSYLGTVSDFATGIATSQGANRRLAKAALEILNVEKNMSMACSCEFSQSEWSWDCNKPPPLWR